VSSAMEAAAGILDDMGVTHRDMPSKCFEVPTWAFRAAQFLFAPAVPPLWLWSQLEALR